MDTTTPSSEFTLIDTHGFKKNKKVKRVLPDWLAKPTVVSVDLKHLEVPIDGIPELDPALVQKLKNKGCTHFFPGNLNHIQITTYTLSHVDHDTRLLQFKIN